MAHIISEAEPAAGTIGDWWQKKSNGEVKYWNGTVWAISPGWTADKLLKGAGAGVAPTEIDVPTGALTLAGSDTTERSGNAVGADANTLSSVSGLNIPANVPVFIIFKARKTAGAAVAPTVGFKINATVVHSTAVGVIIIGGATNAAGDSIMMALLFPGEANYTRGGIIFRGGTDAGGGSSTGLIQLTATAALPAANITSITITGNALNALVTMATYDMYVYTFAVA